MDYQKGDVFKIAKRLVNTNQDIIGEQCVRNCDVLAVSDEDKEIAWKSYQEKPLNTEIVWDRKMFPQANTVSGVPRLIEKDIVRESTSKAKYGKVARPSGLVPEMVRRSKQEELT